MSDRSQSAKPLTQDALGFLFVLVGGFFAVSVVLFLNGQEPIEGFISRVTWPVVELVAQLGALSALLFSAGLAALGTMLFLRPTPISSLRPLLALGAFALGMALVAGVFGRGGELGALFPGLLSGLLGRLVAVVVGLALLWLGWTLLPVTHVGSPRAGESLQRVALRPTHADPAGVSSAEAALLVSEPRQATRLVPRRDEAVPLREQALRPAAPVKPIPSPERKAEPTRAAGESSRPATESRPALPAEAPSKLEVGTTQDSFPTPSWEVEEAEEELESLAASQPQTASLGDLDDEELDEEVGDAEEDEESADVFSADLAESFEGEEELIESDEEEEELEPAEPAVAPVPKASWEQIGLFDEEPEVAEEAAQKERREALTPSFDFDAFEPKRPRHEPEPDTSIPAPPRAAEERSAEVPPVFTLQPTPAARAKPEPVSERAPERDEESGSWERLVFEAGCLILEQKRVTVSMLERRFTIDFDRACKVLDELQQAGLIGPYMGGRTRDILLTREQWLPHAPHAT